MDGGLYERDFYTWTQLQAAALRRLAETRPNLPEDIDLAQVAEEIGDMGSELVSGVRSHLRLMLQHLILLAAAPDDPSVAHWRGEVATFQANAESRYLPSMRQQVEPVLDKEWRSAMRAVTGKLGRLGRAFPNACPFTLDELLDIEAEIDTLVARVASPTES